MSGQVVASARLHTGQTFMHVLHESTTISNEQGKLRLEAGTKEQLRKSLQYCLAVSKAQCSAFETIAT